MSDDDRAADAVERPKRGTSAIGMCGTRVIERQIRGEHGVAACSQPTGDGVPAGPVVPLPVDQTERGHATGIPRRGARRKWAPMAAAASSTSRA